MFLLHDLNVSLWVLVAQNVKCFSPTIRAQALKVVFETLYIF